MRQWWSDVAKIHTKYYTLDDSTIVTTKSVSLRVGISESAARNRLVRHTDPTKVYEAQNPANGGKRSKNKPKRVDNQSDQDWMNFILKII